MHLQRRVPERALRCEQHVHVGGLYLAQRVAGDARESSRVTEFCPHAALAIDHNGWVRSLAVWLCLAACGDNIDPIEVDELGAEVTAAACRYYVRCGLA